MGEVVRLIDRHGEYRGEACLACQEKDQRLAQLRRKITELENEQEQKVEKRHPLDPQIMEVCLFHKQLLSPSWKIVRNRGAYNDVKDRLHKDIDAETGEPAFTVAHLRAASVGLSMCGWTRERGIKSASWLFGQTSHVEWMLDEAISFKRQYGTSALHIVDVLGKPGLEKLAAECGCCGHLRLEHEQVRPELDLWDPPCGVHGCACPGYEDSWEWRIARFQAEQARERVNA